MSTQRFDGSETISDILFALPEGAEILQGYGLGCVGCHVNSFETLESGVLSHGMGQEVLDTIVSDLNEAAKDSAGGGGTTDGRVFEMSSVAEQKLLQFAQEDGYDPVIVRIEVLFVDDDSVSYFLDFEDSMKPVADNKTIELHYGTAEQKITLRTDSASLGHLRTHTMDYTDVDDGGFFFTPQT